MAWSYFRNARAPKTAESQRLAPGCFTFMVAHVHPRQPAYLNLFVASASHTNQAMKYAGW